MMSKDKDNHDPGWNDPPVFTFDKAAAIQAAAANKKGFSLNKRVAFPISNNLENQPKNHQTSSPLNADSSKPPKMSQSPSSKLSCVKSEMIPQTENELGAKDKLEIILKNLQIETNHDEEITKRIRIMEKMWIGGKLEEKVQLRLFELSQALAKGETDTADYIQMGLMVDYVSQCSSWMSGIRHLINQKKSDENKEKS